MSLLHVDAYTLGKQGEPNTLPNLVLIHGWGMHGGVWQPVAKKLASYFNLHIVDLPGMGFSKPVEPNDLDAIAEKVIEILPPSADVCGWSFGTHVIMRAALKQPDKFRRLILIAGTPRFVNSTGANAWEMGINAEVYKRFATSVSQDYQDTLIRFFSLQCMGAEEARTTIKQLRKSFAERPVPTMGTLQKALRILLENDMREDIAFLKKPVLLVHGDRDRLVPVQAGHWMAQHLPFGHLRVIAGAGHAPFLSHQSQFVEALVQYLEPAVAMAR